jgi:hypothetical protein
MKQLYDEEVERQFEFLNSLGGKTDLLIDTQWNRPQRHQSCSRNACTVLISVPFNKALCVYPVSVDFPTPSLHGDTSGSTDGSTHEEVEIPNPPQYFEEGMMIFKMIYCIFFFNTCCRKSSQYSTTHN